MVTCRNPSFVIDGRDDGGFDGSDLSYISGDIERPNLSKREAAVFTQAKNRARGARVGPSCCAFIGVAIERRMVRLHLAEDFFRLLD
jgi:hypothetical protein